MEKYYEIGFLLSPTLEQINAETVGKEIDAAIGKIGGTVVDGETPRLRRLAYPIYKVISGKKIGATTGYFGWTKFSVDAEAGTENIDTLNATVEKMEEILRFILIKTIKEKTYVPQEPEQIEENVSEEISGVEEIPDGAVPEVENDSKEGEVVVTTEEE